ncbi:MAG: type I-E CRISPR-associated protein Cse1/CasA [Dehalococcoidia bacterium]|nr:type I-E CRISPR-associated protein Cse1/CasA [Dehalococcoidia bacterium]
MAEFNLIDEGWIPCIHLDGKQAEYSIRDILLRAHNLREMCDGSPLVTAALHRLLLAILYRAYGGPSDMAEWRDIYSSGAFAASEKVEAYLTRWYERFYLFSNDHPFFQMAELDMKVAVPVTRLATECASGNNATLFDHSADAVDANWSPGRAARWLVSCQAFALGFGKGGNASMGGIEEVLPYATDAIALRGVTVWLQGKSLFETLMVNLDPIDDESLPPWELDDPHRYRDTTQGRSEAGSRGVVDRFTWQSRLIRLLPSDGTVSRMYFGQGRSADKNPDDPMKVYRASKQLGVLSVPLNSSRAAWRDAHALLMIPAADGRERRPECFNVVARAYMRGTVRPASVFVTNVVGLASAPNKAGKFLLWRHERIPCPAELLSSTNLVEHLGLLLALSERVARMLRQRTWRMASLYLAPDNGLAQGRQPDRKDVSALVESIDPSPAYWARLEQHFYPLLAELHKDWDVGSGGWKPDEQQMASGAWREHVKSEAQRALEESIRSLGTSARALQAVARVRTSFTDNDLAPQSQKLSKAMLKRR